MIPELPEEHVDTQNLNNRTPVLGWRSALKSASKIVGTAIPGVRVSKDSDDSGRPRSREPLFIGLDS